MICSLFFLSKRIIKPRLSNNLFYSFSNIPKESKIISCTAFGYDNLDIKVENVISNLKDHEFLLKVHASPINPLDMQKIQGKMAAQPPFTPGSECSGNIIYSKSLGLLNKKAVVYVPTGAWKNYVIGSTRSAIILQDHHDLDTAACAYVNPLTSLGLVSQAKLYDCNTIINTAANSQLGKMIHRVATMQNYNVINLVRKKETQENLKKELNTQQVIDYESETFIQELKEYCKDNKTLCLDPVGGELSGKIFNAMPAESVQCVYGSLSGKDISGINGVQVRWANKQLVGFVLNRYLSQQDEQKVSELTNFVDQNLADLFKTKIVGTYKFDQVKEALQYYAKNQSTGKVLIKPTHVE